MNGALLLAGQAVLLAAANAAHCAGMCGPFMAQAARGGGRGVPLFLAGKCLTYVTFGAVAGALGASALQASRAAQPWLALLVGIVLGVSAVGMLRGRPLLPAGGRSGTGFLTRRVGALLRADLPGGRFTLGALSGALPCGVVGLALAQGLQAGTPAAAAGQMLVFGLATGPALLLAGWLLEQGSQRLHLRTAGGVLLLGVAALSFWRAAAGFTDTSCPLCPS